MGKMSSQFTIAFFKKCFGYNPHLFGRAAYMVGNERRSYYTENALNAESLHTMNMKKLRMEGILECRCKVRIYYNIRT